MKLAYQTNAWGGVAGHPAGVTCVKDLYYFSADCATDDALAAIAKAGYDGFELFDGNLMAYADKQDEFRAMVARHGLTFVGVYTGGNFIFEEILAEELSKIRLSAELAAELGATHLVIGGGGVRASGIEEADYQRLGAGLEQVVAIADAVGMVASFHPHLGTCAETPEQIAKVFAHTTINFCPDTAHLQAAGGDPAELIRTYADRVKYVHLKDFDNGQFLPLGAGSQNLPEIMEVLHGMAFDGWIGVEADGYAGSADEAAATSRTYLERWQSKFA